MTTRTERPKRCHSSLDEAVSDLRERVICLESDARRRFITDMVVDDIDVDVIAQLAEETPEAEAEREARLATFREEMADLFATRR